MGRCSNVLCVQFVRGIFLRVGCADFVCKIFYCCEAQRAWVAGGVCHVCSLYAEVLAHRLRR